MRRALSALVGLVLATALGLIAPAYAAPAESTFQVAIVVDEGPSPAAGTVQQFSANLTSGAMPIAGVPVTLTARPYGATAFTAIGHGTTDEDGDVTVSAALRRTSRIQWTFAGDGAHAATSSVAYLRPVGSRVAARALDRTLRGRQRVVVVGRAVPLKPGHRVSLWRGDIPCFCVGTSSTRIAAGTVRPDGTFRLTARFARPGVKKLYVKVNAGHGNDIGYSAYVRIRVR